MNPFALQTEIGLSYFSAKINNISEEVNFYRGEISQLKLIHEPALIMYERKQSSETSSYPDYIGIKVTYLATPCENNIPENTTHFCLVSEPPITKDQANNLLQRFSKSSNFILQDPVQDPFGQ